MRKSTKMKILNSLETVDDALQSIRSTTNIDKKKKLHKCLLHTEAIIQTLTQAGSGSGMMAMKLRRFDQSLSQAMDFVDQPDVFAGEAATLAEQFTLIRSKVDKIQPKLEIVFLPYKASMWDSMESIWRAAVADKTCNAHVIPIPYYDLNVDLTIAKYYDESSLFPEDVPITDYRGYDLAKNRPDIIYFHNPYDGENLVTSVLPEFYSDKLKQYTDLLVYVPYFVEFGELTQTLAQKPGCANADLIIAHSEANKKSYMEYYPEEKIAVLGAPQIDKVLRTHEHRPELPEEWRRIAKGRKLILYNMSLKLLMRKDGSACRKLRYVFSCFAGRQDVCLLWRPHPLSVATMNSMNERVLEEYQKLIEAYKKNELGIYDDSPDVHRAIELSDAYYGDWSSLVPMYEATGKPIMMQDVEIFEDECEDRYRYIPLSDAVFDGNTMWFTSACGNMLFKMDLGTEKVEFVDQIPGRTDGSWLYSKIVKVENRLFLIPATANVIVEYDTKTLHFKEHSIVEYLQTLSPAGTFRSAFLHKNWIYCIPNIGKEVLRIHVDSGVIEVYRDWYQDLQQYVVDEDKSLFADAMQVDNFVWCPFRQGNKIVRFDLETMQIALYEVGDRKSSYFSITFDGDRFWMMKNDGCTLISWDPLTKHTNAYPMLSKKCNLQQQNLGWCAYSYGIIWVLPVLGNHLIKFHTKMTKAEQVKSMPDNFSYIAGARFEIRFGGVQTHENRIIAFSMGSNRMLQIDGEKGVIHGKKICFSSTRQIEILKNIIYREGTHCSCNSFFECFGESNFVEKDISGKTVELGNYGEIIHRDVLSRIQK